jgi:o-succinylbenzoate synthase
VTALSIANDVTRVSWRGFRVPFRAAFRAAHGSMTAREGFVVEVEAASGVRGIGEASPLPSFTGGSLDETAVALGALARGKDIPPGLASGSVAAARCGFETAVADASARRLGLTLGGWLAGDRGRHSATPAFVPVNAVIDLDSVDGIAEAVSRAVADGYPAVKLKVGGDPASDAARVAAAREAGGPAIELRVDANRAWSHDDALAFLRAIEPVNVALCEEPLAPSGDHFAALAALRRETAVPLGIDESCPSRDLLARSLDAGAAEAVVIKPMVTGLDEAVATVVLARRSGLRAIVTTTFDTGIGTALAAHLASLLPEPVPACGLATLDHLEHPLVVDPPRIRRGSMMLPGGPGLGVTLDRAALDRYATGLAGEVRR